MSLEDPFTLDALDSIAERLPAKDGNTVIEAAVIIAELRDSLSDLLENPAYQTAIGGNPNAVDGMLARAFAALRRARGEVQP